MEWKNKERGHVKNWSIAHINLQMVLWYEIVVNAKREEGSTWGAGQLPPFCSPYPKLWRAWDWKPSSNLFGRESPSYLTDCTRMPLDMIDAHHQILGTRCDFLTRLAIHLQEPNLVEVFSTVWFALVSILNPSNWTPLNLQKSRVYIFLILPLYFLQFM